MYVRIYTMGYTHRYYITPLQGLSNSHARRPENEKYQTMAVLTCTISPSYNFLQETVLVNFITPLQGFLCMYAFIRWATPIVIILRPFRAHL